jgi:hypothetical protein
MASYSSCRFGFKADVIEPLAMEDLFAMTTPEGTFRMTKAQFYADFPGVMQSKSYLETRVYHYKKPPQRALKYRVGEH